MSERTSSCQRSEDDRDSLAHEAVSSRSEEQVWESGGRKELAVN